MRPHVLEIEGFGPFPDLQTVDFDAAGADGIFLIAGPTGAGKTSILDALCFALYGVVPGARGAAKELRAAQAGPSVPTRVCLEFSLGQRRFSIERSPQYQRARKRGGGTTTQAHRVSLTELRDGEWAGVGRTGQEVQSFLHELLGLNAEQFTKLILLPQGEFSAFLHADPGQREAILTRLFATEHFAAVESELADRATEARRQSQAVQDRRRFRMERAAESLWERLPLPIAGGTDLADLIAHLGAALTLSREARDAAAHVCALTDEEARRAGAENAAQQCRAADRTALRTFESEWAQWEAGEPERTRALQSLDLARAAAPLTPLQSEAGRAAIAADTAARKSAEADEALWHTLPPAHSATALSELAPEMLARAADSVSAALSRLQRAEELQLGLRKAGADDEAAQQAHVRATAASAQNHTSLTTTREAIRELEKRSETLATGAGELETLRTQRTVLADRAQAQVEHRSARTAYETAAATAEESAQTLAGLRRQLRESLAGRLAAGLAPGEPCAVCGSTEHPAPAQLPPAAPSQDEEDAAEERERSAREALAAARARFEDAGAQLGAATGAAQGLEPAEVERRWQAALEDAEQARRATSELQRLRLEAADAEKRGDALHAVQQQAQEHAAAAASEHARMRARAEESAENPDDPPVALALLGLHLPETAAEARESLTRIERIDATRRAREAALAQAEDAARTRRLRDADFAAALRASPFSDARELAHAAQLPQAALADQVDEARRRSAQLQEHAASTQLARARADEADDDVLTAAAEAASERARLWLDRAEQARSRTAVAADRAAAAAQESADARAESGGAEAQLRERLRDVDIAELALGTSAEAAQRMSLSSFALVAVFAEVAAHASERLQAMTSGRFRLVHTMRQGPREKRAGLGLRVVDTFTDESRDPRSLSGGESFMASLALALGLADAVRAATAAADLQTLFLDEGFGTLDPDALADVLAVLDSLRTGGRTIGLISHVSEMRQTLPTRVVVTPGPAGSQIRMQ